jgi:hypothetical protein
MAWLAFAYSLISQRGSSARVAVWRRLQQLGTISLKNGLYVLPESDEHLEAFQWLAQQVQESNGEATIMRVDRFEGVTDGQLMDLFRAGCLAKYEQLDRQVASLEKQLHRSAKKDTASIGRALKKLQRQCDEIVRLDFFDSPHGQHVKARLRQLKLMYSRTSPDQQSAPKLAAAALSDYQDRTWVTRPRPHVDRLACAWFIRQYINPKTTIRYSTQPRNGEVRFDMRGAEFGHEGSLCTFETMVHRFGLSEPALQVMGEIVHEVDLRDGLYAHVETLGVDAILRGWLLDKLSDEELERYGIVLFQGLYKSLARRQRELNSPNGR